MQPNNNQNQIPPQSAPPPAPIPQQPVQPNPPAQQPIAQAVPTSAMPQGLVMPTSQPQTPVGSKAYSNLAIASIVMGGLSIPASLLSILTAFIPILGIVFGAISLKSSKKGLAISGMILSIVGLILSVAVLIIGISEENKPKTTSTPAVSKTSISNSVSTDCFITTLPEDFTTSVISSKCDIEAKAKNSREEVSIVAITPEQGYNTADFEAENTNALIKIVQSVDPTISIVKQSKTTFSNQPAYYAEITNSANQKGAVYYIYTSSTYGEPKYQLFLVTLDTLDGFDTLETIKNNWQWK